MTDARNLVTVQRLIPAPAAAIFDLLADPSRHAQIDGSGTVIAPTSAGSRRLALGDTFGMSMKMGVGYSTRNVVIEFEPDRLIAWQTLAAAPWTRSSPDGSGATSLSPSRAAPLSARRGTSPAKPRSPARWSGG